MSGNGTKGFPELRRALEDAIMPRSSEIEAVTDTLEQAERNQSSINPRQAGAFARWIVKALERLEEDVWEIAHAWEDEAEPDHERIRRLLARRGGEESDSLPGEGPDPLAVEEFLADVRSFLSAQFRERSAALGRGRRVRVLLVEDAESAVNRAMNHFVPREEVSHAAQ